MSVKLQFRRDTSVNWISVNPVLSIGELGLETDTLHVKMGDGVTHWNFLGYSFVGPQGIQGEKGDTGNQGIQGNPGPNQITTSTVSNITGILKGNGSSVEQLSLSESDLSSAIYLKHNGSNQDTEISGKITANNAITGATKTKITYDSKGLVTSGADATTADIADSTDKRYCTDAQKTVINNTSGNNTGDASGHSGLEVTSSKGVASGYCGLNASLKVAIGNLQTGTTVNDVCIGNDSRLSDARVPVAHNQGADTITTGTLDGDRLPALSTTKKGGVPATGTPSGKYLKDDGTWSTVSGGSTPTGTGWRHVTSGIEDAATTIPSASDVLLGNVTNESKATMFTNAALTSIPTSPTAAIGTNTTQIATTAFVKAADGANLSRYLILMEASGSHIAAKVAGTYAIGQGDALVLSGTGALYPIQLINIQSADFPTIDGFTTKLRIRATVSVNAVAPTGNFTIGLYPVTSGGGAAGLKIYTMGTLVSGSATTTVTAPSANSMTNVNCSDFALPANGVYALAVVTTATVATSSLVHINAQLQMRNT